MAPKPPGHNISLVYIVGNRAAVNPVSVASMVLVVDGPTRREGAATSPRL